MHNIASIIGMLLRDIIVYFSNEYIDYYIVDNYYIYKTKLPFSFSIGKYKFITAKDYYKMKSNDLVKHC